MKKWGNIMKGLRNLKIKTKIISILLITSIASMFIGIVGIIGIRNSNSKMLKIYNRNFVPLEQLKTVSDMYAVNIVGVTYKVINGRVSWIEGEKQIKAGRESIEKAWQSYTGNQLTDFEKDLVAQAEKHMKLANSYVDKLLTIMKEQDRDKLVKFAANDLDLSMDPIVSKVTEIVDEQLQTAKKEYDNSNRSYTIIMSVLSFTLIVGLLVSIVIGLIVIKAISNQVKLIQEAVSKDASGNVSIKTIKINSKDELGQLASSINAVTEQVQTFIKNTSQSAESVANMGQQLTAATEQSAQAVSQVASTVAEVAVGTGKQVKAVSDTTSIVSQISSDIERIMDNTNNMQNAFRGAEMATGHGKQSVEKVITQMKRVEKTVEDSASLVQRLGERTKEIEQIAGTISNIASQTDLLALNAAIEAARAGEHGRGFSVVAEEVRKLAIQSQASVVKVTNIIKEIVEDTMQAQDSMMIGTREVKLGTEVVNIAEQSFTEIAQLVSDTSDKAKEISLAIQQMAENSEQIVESIHEIEEISNTTASQMQEIAASTLQQSDLGVEVVASSQHLAKLAEDLQTEVNTFKL
jgi:methyl-accepting chemotaxis protein